MRIKHLISSLFGHLVFRSGLHVLSLRDIIPVLTFHRLSEPSPTESMNYRLKDFKDLCKFLSCNFQVKPLSHILKKMLNGGTFQQELAITFDDGYRNNYELAAPVLKALNLPATFFLTTQYIGTDIVSWWDEKAGVRHKWMSWDQVRALHRQGFEIGSHTKTHYNLGNVHEEQTLKELVESRVDLEAQLSAPVTLFAYPYGGPDNINERNRELVKAAGYSCCCSCFGGLNTGGTDPFHIRRIPISHWYQSPQDFGFRAVIRRV